jgi:hypothetical protein
MNVSDLASVVLLSLVIMKAMLLHGMLKVKENYMRYIPSDQSIIVSCTIISFSIVLLLKVVNFSSCF